MSGLADWNITGLQVLKTQTQQLCPPCLHARVCSSDLKLMAISIFLMQSGRFARWRLNTPGISCTSKPLYGPVRCSLWLCGELERCLPWAFITQLLYFTFWVTQAYSASQRKASRTFQRTAQRPSEMQGVPNIDTWSLWCPLGAISRQQRTEARLSDADVSAETNILSEISSFPPTAYQQPFYILRVDYFIWPQDLFLMETSS